MEGKTRQRDEIERICTFYPTATFTFSLLNLPPLSQVDRVEWIKGKCKMAESLTITKLLILVISLALSQSFC